jgi:hypothetical protein
MSKRFKGWEQIHVDNCHNWRRQLKTKVNKYGNERHNEIYGHKFDSKKEMNRYRQLKILEDAKVIHGLKVHLMYPLIVNGCKIADYEADFVYYEQGMLVVEDVKGFKTPVYGIKKKLMFALFDIIIKET